VLRGVSKLPQVRTDQQGCTHIFPAPLNVDPTDRNVFSWSGGPDVSYRSVSPHNLQERQSRSSTRTQSITDICQHGSVSSTQSPWRMTTVHALLWFALYRYRWLPIDTSNRRPELAYSTWVDMQEWPSYKRRVAFCFPRMKHSC